MTKCTTVKNTLYAIVVRHLLPLLLVS